MTPSSKWILALLVALSLGIGTSVQAQSMDGSGVEAHEAWIRATPPNASSSAAYMHLMNYQNTPDALIAASSPLAEVTEIHNVREQDGMMRMFPVDAVDIPAEGMAELKPGSFHVMFIKLKQAPQPGETYPVTLRFRHAPEITVQVPVMQNAAPMDHDTMHKMHHGSDNMKN